MDAGKSLVIGKMEDGVGLLVSGNGYLGGGVTVTVSKSGALAGRWGSENGSRLSFGRSYDYAQFRVGI